MEGKMTMIMVPPPKKSLPLWVYTDPVIFKFSKERGPSPSS